MRKNVIISDLIFYVIFPLVIWNLGRDYLGDYYAMLVSSVPGIIYSMIRFILLKRIHLLGIFLIANLIVQTLVDVLAGSAIQMLWNGVLFSYISAALFILTILANKPIVLYFSLDVVEMQGYDRKRMKESFYERKILFLFKLITFGFALKKILLASIKVGLIYKYGVEAFDKGILIRQIINWGISGISIYGFIHISQLLNRQNGTNDQDLKLNK